MHTLALVNRSSDLTRPRYFDDEPGPNVGGRDPFERIIDLADGDPFDIGTNSVQGAKIQHRPGFLDAPDDGPGVGLKASRYSTVTSAPMALAIYTRRTAAEPQRRAAKSLEFAAQSLRTPGRNPQAGA